MVNPVYSEVFLIPNSGFILLAQRPMPALIYSSFLVMVNLPRIGHRDHAVSVGAWTQTDAVLEASAEV